MPFFRYKVRDRFGAAVTGVVEGDNTKTVALNLRHLGYSVITVNERGGIEIFLDNLLLSVQKIKHQEVILFTRQISVMLKAGLPLLESIEGATSEIRNNKFKDIIKEVKEDVEGGASFNEALVKHPEVFSSLYVNMVKAG